MPSAEAASHWVDAATTLGGGFLFWLAIWAGNYFRRRGDERLKAERSQEVAASAVGAAFPIVDRTATQTLLEILDYTKKIFKLLSDRQVHDAEIEATQEAQRRIDKLVAEAAKKLEDKMRMNSHPNHSDRTGGNDDA